MASNTDSVDSFRYDVMSPQDVSEVENLICQTLHFPRDITKPWIENMGIENFRVLRDDSRITASLSIMYSGLWFQGNPVECACIRAVGVPPEFRGYGTATQLMGKMLEELYRSGTPLSALFPSTLALYRKSGYERAGYRFTYDIPLKTINFRDHSLKMERLTDIPQAIEICRNIYNQRARVTSGNLDRPDYLWNRILAPAEMEVFRYLVRDNNHPIGYIAFTQAKREMGMEIRDICALNRDAAVRLLTFLSDHRSMMDNVEWSGGPSEPIHHILREQSVEVRRSLAWMVRIVDVERALKKRKYPPGLTTELHLEIRDDLLSGNNNRYVLSVEDGSGSVKLGGAGHLRMDIRDLAPLYTGFITPRDLRDFGGLTGTEEELDRASLVFAGPPPGMPDIF